MKTWGVSLKGWKMFYTLTKDKKAAGVWCGVLETLTRPNTTIGWVQHSQTKCEKRTYKNIEIDEMKVELRTNKSMKRPVWSWKSGGVWEGNFLKQRTSLTSRRTSRNKCVGRCKRTTRGKQLPFVQIIGKESIDSDEFREGHSGQVGLHARTSCTQNEAKLRSGWPWKWTEA